MATGVATKGSYTVSWCCVVGSGGWKLEVDCALPVSAIEKGEMLEQLRAMEDGIAIGIKEVNFTSIGVDTPEELEKVRQILAQKR